MAWNVLQGVPGPKCLSLEAFSVMTDLQFNTSQAIEALCDEEIKEVLKGLKGCVSEGEFNAIKESGGDLIANHGYSRVLTADFSKKSEVQHCLLTSTSVCQFSKEQCCTRHSLLSPPPCHYPIVQVIAIRCIFIIHLLN